MSVVLLGINYLCIFIFSCECCPSCIKEVILDRLNNKSSAHV